VCAVLNGSHALTSSLAQKGTSLEVPLNTSPWPVVTYHNSCSTYNIHTDGLSTDGLEMVSLTSSLARKGTSLEVPLNTSPRPVVTYHNSCSTYCMNGTAPYGTLLCCEWVIKCTCRLGGSKWMRCDNHISAGRISVLTLTFPLISTMELTD
jgi:hypothetical protein